MVDFVARNLSGFGNAAGRVVVGEEWAGRECCRMRFDALLNRHERGELSQGEAAEGVSERTFRRWRDRTNARVFFDSPKRAPYVAAASRDQRTSEVEKPFSPDVVASFAKVRFARRYMRRRAGACVATELAASRGLRKTVLRRVVDGHASRFEEPEDAQGQT